MRLREKGRKTSFPIAFHHETLTCTNYSATVQATHPRQGILVRSPLQVPTVLRRIRLGLENGLGVQQETKKNLTTFVSFPSRLRLREGLERLLLEFQTEVEG